MIILALDTSAESFSVALARDGALVAEASGKVARTHARHIVQSVETTLARAGLSLDRVDAVAVTRGPGSFTGVRIGMAAAKGIAFALKKPLAGVSSLAALALGAAREDLPVWAVIDARRGEVYAASYRLSGEKLAELSPEEAARPQDWAEALSGPALFVGDGARLHRELIADRLGEDARFAPQEADIIQGLSVAKLGRTAVLEGACLAPSSGPTYLRPPDIQIPAGKK